jgi:predicted ATPase
MASLLIGREMHQPDLDAPEAFTLHPIPHHQSHRWQVDAALTGILGRDTEMGEIERSLDRGDLRLLTLTGAGGIGKTRLAREVARRMQGEFAHGACFVSFAALRDPELVASAAVKALGLPLMTDRPAQDLVIDALHDRHVLLVLDNLEHLVDAAAPWLSHLLQRCPRVSALVNSRVPLRIAGEHRFAVEPLPVPELSCDRVEELAAVELFVQRASAIVPGFKLTRGNAGIVAGICRAVDGLPLAIELAAGQIRLISPGQLLQRLSNRLTELHSDRRDAPPRHQTMHDAIAWSYDLLDAKGKRLFRRLAVFVGGFSLDGALATGGLEGDNIDAHLLELVEHSLVNRRDGGPDGYRFDMLEVVREFGLSQLEVSEESDGARDEHAAWNLRLARDAEPRMSRPEQVEWLDRLELEHDNIRQAVAWLTHRERIDEAMDLTGSLWFFRWIRGYYRESREQFEQLLALPQGRNRTLARAKALAGLGIVATHQGDFDRSREALAEAVGISTEQGDQRWGCGSDTGILVRRRILVPGSHVIVLDRGKDPLHGRPILRPRSPGRSCRPPGPDDRLAA